MSKKLNKNYKTLLTPIKSNTFQVVGGEYRGRKFSFPDVEGLRPSPNKVRETLFNWIQFETQDKTFLDVFTGSGSLSFEALSRGAKCVVSVEQNREAFNFLEHNKTLLKTDRLQLVNADAFVFLAQSNSEFFDFILLDPPFNKNYLIKALKLIAENGFVAKGSKIYIESEFEITLDFLVQHCVQKLTLNKQKKSGLVHYCLLNYE